jgi:hypothetical protein
MIFVKSFKGYEDKLGTLDDQVNGWLTEHQVQVMAVNSVLSHEYEGRAGSGDLIYTVVYKADAAVKG